MGRRSIAGVGSGGGGGGVREGRGDVLPVVATKIGPRAAEKGCPV